MRLNHFKNAITARRAKAPRTRSIQNINMLVHSNSMAGCVNAVRAIVCFELPARKVQMDQAVSVIVFENWTSCDLIAFILYSFIEVN